MPKLSEELNTEIQSLLDDAVKIKAETWDKDKPMSNEQGKEYEEKCQKAEELQKQLDQLKSDKVTSLNDHRRKLRNDPAIIPDAGDEPERKSDRIVGYLTPGQAVVESKEFQAYLDAGKPQSGASPVYIGSYFDEGRFKALDEKAFDERAKSLETKAVPTIGADVIRPDRLTEVIRQTEFDRLVLRDMVRTLPTSSNAVDWVRITSDQPDTAAPTAESAAKPESTVATDAQSSTVRTLAVHMPVTEQQLEDVPQIRSIIDDYLGFDLARLEEYQMVWGDGTGENLLGIMNTSGVNEFTRSVGADTLIDKIRGAITEIRNANLEPNTLAIAPLDWETIAVTKGTDNHYLAQIFPTSEGQFRVWGLRVVETPAMTAYRSADSTDQRVIIVGDFMRGATLWDRHQTRIQVGYINAQFTQNQRTIRAEERVAFAAQRPSAFQFIETVAAVV